MLNNYTPKSFFIFLFVSPLFLSHFLGAQGNCSSPEAETNIAVNELGVYLESCGLLDWSGQSVNAFEFPNGSGNNVFFDADLWMGGVDDQGSLKLAAQTYHQGGALGGTDSYDYYPGPLTENGLSNNVNCQLFDRFWEVSSDEINNFRLFYSANGGIPINMIPESIKNWPGKNNPLFSEFTLPQDKDLAPFYDYNNDGIYNPLTGDFPSLKNGEFTYANKMIWQIFNDMGNLHQDSGGENIGVEINALVYSYVSEDFLNRTTFINYDLTYLGDDPLFNYYVGIWVDPDLGDYADDYIGCMPNQDLGFVYNGDDNDPAGFGDQIPVGVVKVLEGLEDENGDLGMSGFMWYGNYFPEEGGEDIGGNPTEPQDYYNTLQSNWYNGSPAVYGGQTGTGEQWPYLFSDDPNDEDGWSECATEAFPGDRKFLLTSGPIELNNGDQQNFKVSMGVLYPDEFDSYYCGNFPTDEVINLGNDLADFNENPTSLLIGDTLEIESTSCMVQNTIVVQSWLFGVGGDTLVLETISPDPNYSPDSTFLTENSNIQNLEDSIIQLQNQNGCDSFLIVSYNYVPYNLVNTNNDCLGLGVDTTSTLVLNPAGDTLLVEINNSYSPDTSILEIIVETAAEETTETIVETNVYGCDSVVINNFVLEENSMLAIERLALSKVAIFPNPATDFIHFKIKQQNNHLNKLKIFNATGKMVEYLEIRNFAKIETANFVSGIYIYNIQNSLGEIQSGKFLVK